MKERRSVLGIVVAVLLSLCVLSVSALAEEVSSVSICGTTWSTSTYAKTVDGRIVTDGASADDYNLYWDAAAATLTLQNAELEVKDTAAIAADVERLTVHLVGNNTISSENGLTDADYAAVVNSGAITFTGADEASLNVAVEQTAALSGAASYVAGISAGSGITNSTVISVEVSAAASVNYGDDLYGLKSGVDESKPGTLNNSGSITAVVSNGGLGSYYGTNSYAVFVYGGAVDNSGTLDMTVSTVNGDAYGLRGSSTTELWNNEGKIISNVTAYGGNYEGVDENLYKFSNHACAVSVVTGSADGLEMQNSGVMELYAVNYGQNKYYEYAIGLELDSNATVFTNSGTINIKALEAYTWGIYMSNLTDDATLKNSGDITVEATTNGKMCESNNPYSYSVATGIGINMTNYDENPDPVKTEMILESGSRLNISTKAAESVKGGLSEEVIGDWALLAKEMAGIDVEAEAMTYEQWVNYQYCQAIQLQKVFYADPNYGEVPQDISMADDLIILEGESDYDGGELIAVFEDYYLDMLGIYPYINTIGNYFTDPDDGSAYSMPSKNVVILPAMPGTVAIDGTSGVGQTLTAKTEGIPDGVEVLYQWQVCDTPDGTFVDIDGATEESYLITSAQAGKYVRVVITPGENSGYAGYITAVTEDTVSSSSYYPITYPPATEQPENGSFTITPQYPEYGDRVTITPQPDDGFAVDEVAVTGSAGNNIEVTDNGDGTYSFTQPADTVRVRVTFRPEACDGGEDCPSSHLNDVDAEAWYHEAVDYVLENGLMNGTGSTAFSPREATSRGMLVTILYRMENEPAVAGGCPFDDVAPDSYYEKAIAWAAANGIVTGHDDGSFRPDDGVTREQMAAVFYRYAQYKGYNVGVGEDTNILSYADFDEISEYAVSAMQWACGAGLVLGDGAKLMPRGSAERCQTAEIMMRFCETVVK